MSSKDCYEALNAMRERVAAMERDEFPDDVPLTWKVQLLETWKRLVHVQEEYCADRITGAEWASASISIWEELAPRTAILGALVEAFRAEDEERNGEGG